MNIEQKPYWRGAVTRLEIVVEEHGVRSAVAALAKAVKNESAPGGAAQDSDERANLEAVQCVLNSLMSSLDAERKERLKLDLEIWE